MTRGEKWLAKAHKRIEGFCKSRGWRCGPAKRIAPNQYEVWIADRLGHEASVAFDMDADSALLVDDYGMGEELSAKVFDAMLEPAGLAGKPIKINRQLSLPLELHQ